jgi:hypothetical protein
MKKSKQEDPFDILSEAYEKMYERAVEDLHKVKEKTGPLLHKAIDEAKDKAVELEEVSREDATKLADYLKRDINDALYYLSQTGREIKNWLGFETTLLEFEFLDMLLDIADKTTVELQQFKENAAHPEYHTGEITGPGTLSCNKCGEKLHFYKAGKIPPCPKCHATVFHRSTSDF